MRLTYDIHSMTLSRCSLLLEKEDNNILKKYWFVPNKIAKKAFEKFHLDFSRLFNKEGLATLNSMQALKIMMYNNIFNLLPSMYYGIILTYDKAMLDKFKELFSKDPITAGDVYDTIQAEIERMSSKYKELFLSDKKEEKDKEKTLNFDNVITTCELVLGISIDRNIKLYQFKPYYEQALKKSRKINK